ncbi:MAG: hypothetical protein RhofKO_34850 [Rhodothermales bacterium]
MNTRYTFAILTLFAVTLLPVKAQVTLTFDTVPYHSLSDPGLGLEETEVLSNTTTLAFAYPIRLRSSRTQLRVGFVGEYREFEYRGSARRTPNIHDLYAGGLSLHLTHSLSARWSLLSIVTPGVASDFRAKLRDDDFNIQAVVAAIRHMSPNFSFGIGAAYSTQFGQPVPIPVVLLDWNNGKRLRWTTFLPSSSELWYAHSVQARFGMIAQVTGNNFQGDPARYPTGDPQLRYAVVTVGPSAHVVLAPTMALQVDAGVVPYQRLELYDGTAEIESFGLKESAFLRLGFHWGGG